MATANKQWIQVSLHDTASANAARAAMANGTAMTTEQQPIEQQITENISPTPAAPQSNNFGGYGGGEQGNIINDALKNNLDSQSTPPARENRQFPGSSTPPSLEAPRGINIPQLEEIPPLNIEVPSGETVGKGICLSRYSIGYISQIEYFMLQELALRQSLLVLSYSNSEWSETLRTIAKENFDSAARLAAAYYTITGTVYWPSYVPEISSRGVPEVELNRLYSATRWLEGEYRLNAARIADPCLAALYQQLLAIKYDQSQRLLALTGEVIDEAGEAEL